MSKRRRLVLKILLIGIILLMSLGTYSFFTADLFGNTSSDNIVQTTGTLRIEYIDGQALNETKIRPGWSGVKTFKVKNTGTLPVNYDIVFNDLVNTFINDEVLFDGTCTSNQDVCDSIIETPVPSLTDFIKQNIIIEPNEEHSYEITFNFIETDSNQDYNIEAILSGKIEVHEAGMFKIPTKITEILSGYNYNLALDEVGNLYAWGNNMFGNLGDGTTESKNIPTMILAEAKFKSISIGGEHNLALDESGNLYAWGANNFVQLGDGQFEDKTIPTLITTEITFTSISAGGSHSMALDEAGNLYAWGDNSYGQFGNGTYNPNSTPTLVSNDIVFTKVKTSYHHTLGLDDSGNLYAWGRIGVVNWVMEQQN